MVEQEGAIRTPIWADEFLLDAAAIIEERGPFTCGKVEKDILYINVRRAHAEWAKDMRARGESAPGIKPIQRQLNEEAISQYVIERGLQKRMMGANTRVYAFDLDALRRAIDD